MPEDVRMSKRDLVSRVATLELNVADLIHVHWSLDPKAMEKLASEAVHDVEIGHTRVALPVGDHQRERLYTVLETRRRMLKKKTVRANA